MTDYLPTLIRFIENGVRTHQSENRTSMCTAYYRMLANGEHTPCALIDCAECPFYSMPRLEQAKQQLEELQKIQQVRQLIEVSDG